ncbi:MAG: toprim domain-containing protein [Candidatus Bathyarchaeia archaeon]
MAASSLERKLERISWIIEELKDETSRGALLVVEGEKDAEALKSIGIECNIFTIKSFGRNLQDVVDEIGWFSDREIILLMDFDRRGRELTRRLAQSLERMKVKFDLNFWKELSSLLNNELKDVEGLAKYIETLRRKVGRNPYNPIWSGDGCLQTS